MAFLFQISDPEELRITLQVSGKYSPDVLDDLKRRLLDAYREALMTRQGIADMVDGAALDKQMPPDPSPEA